MRTEEQKQRLIAWAEALESGKYSQAMGRLTTLDIEGERGFCCIGVACEVERIPRVSDTYVFPSERRLAYNADDAWFREKFGLSQEDQCKLVKMNDIARKSFKEIAVQLREWAQ